MFKNSNRKLTWYFYVASVVSFLLIVLLGSVVFQNANDIADRVHRADTAALVKNEISRQVDFLARDQSQISNWDDTLKAISGDLDNRFIRREIAEWLWGDFDIHDSVIISPSGEAIVTVQKSKVLEPRTGQTLVDQNRHLVKSTIDKYFDYRRRTNKGFAFDVNPVHPKTSIYAHEFKISNGNVGLILAQAIVPSDVFTLPKGNPFVLLTHKPLAASNFAEIKEKLGLQSFNIVDRKEVLEAKETLNIVAADNLQAVWNSAQPSAEIWNSSKLLILSALGVFGGTLFVFAVIYGKVLSQLQESDARNTFNAMHDPLTELPNRANLDSMLQQLVHKNMQQEAAIICMDIDNFKLINDKLGHQAGDTVLRVISQRAVAVLGNDGMVARTGGDEFVLVVTGSKTGVELLKLCDRLVSNIADTIRIGDVSLQVAASVGVSRWSERTFSASHVIREADQALFRAKKSNRSRTEVMDMKTQQTLAAA